MKYGKSIATFMAGLMSLVAIVYPVLAATSLGSYPSFLLNPDGSLNALVVVGASANSQDVIGATDLASRLAQAAAVTTSVPGGVSGNINGIEKNNFDANFGNLTDQFSSGVIRNSQYSGLKQSTLTYKGNTYNYHEQIGLNNSASSSVYFSHDFSTSGINGTETMVVQSNQVKYGYVFDSALNCTALATSSQNTCTLTSPEYTNPVNVWLLGKPFVIVGMGSNQIIMLSGSVGTATATSGVTFGSYTIYSDVGGTSGGTAFARVLVKDASGNTVDSHVINSGDSFDFTAENITVKVTAARSLQDGTVVGTDVVVGPLGAVQHTYTTSCDVTTTGSAATIFPGETSWCIQIGTNAQTSAASFANSGAIAVGDEIDVVYKPTTSPQYFKYTGSTVTLPLPNNYGEIGFEGWNYNSWATLTFKEVEGISGYFLTAAGTTNSTVAASNLNGIEIDTDTPGTLVDPASNYGYNRAYVLFNETFGSTYYPVLIGFYDATNSRVGVDVQDCTTTGNTTTTKCVQLSGASWMSYNITANYGNSGSAKDAQTIFVNVTSPLAVASEVNGGQLSITSAASWFKAFQIGDLTTGGSGSPPYTQYSAGVLLNWVNKTTTWSTSQPPTFRLYQQDSSETPDVQVQNTPNGGGSAAYQNIGQAVQDVVANNGVIVAAPGSYTGSNQVVIKLPSQALAVKAYVGKMGARTTTTGGTYSQIVPITQSIARLDSEITSSDESSHDLILVGGPCVNTLVASLATSGKFPYTCANWPGRNFGRIQVIDDAFVTGHQVLVVAGTTAAYTRMAANVLQQYDTLLKGQTSQFVELTSATAAGITVPAA